MPCFMGRYLIKCHVLLGVTLLNAKFLLGVTLLNAMFYGVLPY